MCLVYEVYGVQVIYVIENGCGYDDELVVNGEVVDLYWCEYFCVYLCELYCVVVDGVFVWGYFFWFFMDNYEWEDGYMCCFGVVYCDFVIQQCMLKILVLWYLKVIVENCIF